MVLESIQAKEDEDFDEADVEVDGAGGARELQSKCIFNLFSAPQQ